MTRETWRRLAVGGGAVLVVVLIASVVLWHRCGLRGCPDVNMLKGYMPDEASVVLDRDGEEVSKLYVTRRVVVPVDSLPEHVLNAFVAIEDKRFWNHGGVDWRRVLGAIASNVKAGGIEEGSSTITMQLARNVFPEQLPANQKTLWRKLGEARMARQIESRYTKREIMELYLNQIYFGSGAYGIESAAEEYFGKSAARLTLAEAALLAALPRAPSRYNPRANEEAALRGRELVLRRMEEQGLITAQQREEAAEAKLVLREGRAGEDDVAPYFVEAVRRQLEEQLGTALYTEGYTIHTTLDLDVQRVAENELERQLSAIESGRFGGFPHASMNSVRADTANRQRGTPYLQGAMVVMDAQTGDVLALVGGRDYDDSQFNRATQALRQPGSAFKPFVYAAALSSGFSPAHRLADRPLRYVLDDGRVWEPQNYDGSFSGVVSMRQALTHSKNVPTVRLANEVGISRVVGLAEQMGLGRMPAHPAVVLGTAEVTPLNLTAAYAAFATLGQRPEPRFVTRVIDRNGVTVWAQQPNARRVIDPATAFLATSMMRDVVDRGTGTAVRAVGFRGPAAGKTGTTQDAADVWFVGFTPEIVSTVWIGLDRRQRILRRGTGGELAAPVWGRVMARAGLRSRAEWTPPSGLEQHTIDETGMIVAQGCVPQGETRSEYFLQGTAPVGSCYPSGCAYGDTFGWADYDELRDSLAASTADEGWWDRLRRRVLGGDTMRVDSLPRDTTTTPPGQQRPDTTMPPRGQQRPDTVSRPDTLVRPDTAPRPLGRPVRPPPRPIPDTLRLTGGIR